jgi:hypothetical protein
MKQSIFWSLAFASRLLSTSHGFVVRTPRKTGLSPSALLVLPIDPVILQSGLVAAVSAAAGMMTQQPRIQGLEDELRITKLALNGTQQETALKMIELEDKLFVMDQEYEAQTTRFKKRYDTQMKQDLERFKDKVKVDAQFTLEIKLEQQRSAMLTQNLISEGGRTDREGQLSKLRMEVERTNELNRKLEKALQDSDVELTKIRTPKKNPFFSWMR